MTNNSRLKLPESLDNIRLLKPLDYLADYINKTNIRNIYFVGDPSDIQKKELDINIINDVVNEECQAVVFYDIHSVSFDIHKIDDISYLVNTRGVPVICIEDDMSCNTSTIKGFKGNSTRVPDVGYFIKMFTEKKDYKIIGKPNVDLESLIPDFKSRTTCIIGDNVLTDVQQAKNSGCSSILVTKSLSFEDLSYLQ
jgi:ribonucleotide monophosphatase NagD (HAD superfamily)